jgi:hypothetical protein
LYDRVTTSRSRTIIGAFITVDEVPIITFFCASSRYNTISTASDGTAVGTPIFSVQIIVITLFDACPEIPITTPRLLTSEHTRVAVIIVCVVTRFLSLS